MPYNDSDNSQIIINSEEIPVFPKENRTFSGQRRER